jgi:hypothetical protein
MLRSKKKQKSPNTEIMDAQLPFINHFSSLSEDEREHCCQDEEHSDSNNTPTARSTTHSDASENTENEQDKHVDEFYTIPDFMQAQPNTDFFNEGNYCNFINKTSGELTNEGYTGTRLGMAMLGKLIHQQTAFLAQQNSVLNTKLNRILKENEISSQALTVSLDQNQILIDQIQKLESRIQNLESGNQQINYRTATLQNTTASIKYNQKQQLNSAQSYAAALRNHQMTSNMQQTSIQKTSGNPQQLHAHSSPAKCTNNSVLFDSPSPRIFSGNEHACPQNPTDTHAFQHTPALLQQKPESLYALQLCTHQSFKTTADLKNKFLRAVQIKNKLPAINEIFPVKHTVDQFRLRFENVLHRESWLDFFNTHSHLLKSFQAVNLNKTKIALKGIPKQALLHGSKPIIDSLCKQFNLSPQDFFFLFSFEEKKSPDFMVVVFLVSPLVRRFFFQQHDCVFVQQMDVALEISDFHQPHLCTLCGKVGHSKSKCPLQEGCIYCGTTNCSSKNNSCQHKHCLNCLQTDHDTLNRDSCPTIIDLLHRSLDNLCTILAEPFQPLAPTDTPPVPSQLQSQLQSNIHNTPATHQPSQQTSTEPSIPSDLSSGIETSAPTITPVPTANESAPYPPIPP